MAAGTIVSDLWENSGLPGAAPPGAGNTRPGRAAPDHAPLDEMAARHKVVFGQHHLLAAPQQGWEGLKIGGGTPPVRTPDGWLVLYHGVAGQRVAGVERSLRYCAGVLLLDRHDPRRVLYRSAHSVLEPQLAGEREGVLEWSSHFRQSFAT